MLKKEVMLHTYLQLGLEEGQKFYSALNFKLKKGMRLSG